MPPQPGEVVLTTLYETLINTLKLADHCRFVDILYTFSQPNQRPRHERFDKGSFVYVHYSASQGRGRVEIANHPGTPEQDAFVGGANDTIVQC